MNRLVVHLHYPTKKEIVCLISEAMMKPRRRVRWDFRT